MSRVEIVEAWRAAPRRLEQAEGHSDDEAAPRGERGAHQLVTEDRPPRGTAPLRLVRREVLARHQAACFLDVPDEPFGDQALVEAARTLLRQHTESLREDRLPQQRSRARRRTGGEESAHGGRKAGELGRVAAEVGRLSRGHPVAVRSEIDRRRHQVAPAPAPESSEELGHPRDGRGNSGGAGAADRHGVGGEDVGRGGVRCGLTEVETIRLAGAIVDHQDAAATEVAGLRIRHRHRERGGDGRVDRVAAVL